LVNFKKQETIKQLLTILSGINIRQPITAMA